MTIEVLSQFLIASKLTVWAA